MKRTLVAIVLAGTITQAQAYTITAGGTAVLGEGQVTSVLGTVTTDFNSGLLPGNYMGGDIKVGSVVNMWATPPGDTSAYFSVGPSTSTPATASFSSSVDYFGFYWGSPDTYNSVQLWNDGALLTTISGSTLAGLVGVTATGDQSVGVFVNILAGNAGEYFDTVRFTSTTNAFETDNHAVRAVSAIPEPEIYAMLLAGFGLIGFVANRRRQAIAAG